MPGREFEREALRTSVEKRPLGQAELNLSGKDLLRRPNRNLGGRGQSRHLGEPRIQLAVFLLKRCHFIVTDSGGIQEEAPSFGKPVLVTRDTTERPEAMELGLARLVATDEHRLFHEMSALLDDPDAYSRMSRAANPYGDGHASNRIADRLISEAAD